MAEEHLAPSVCSHVQLALHIYISEATQRLDMSCNLTLLLAAKHAMLVSLPSCFQLAVITGLYVSV